MIDWLQLAYNTCWILGLALLLTTLGVSHWQSLEHGQSFLAWLARPGARLCAAAGLGLFALGLLLTSTTWWAQLAWGVLLLSTIWDSVTTWQTWQRTPDR